jgi:hypothetical protein
MGIDPCQQMPGDHVDRDENRMLNTDNNKQTQEKWQEKHPFLDDEQQRAGPHETRKEDICPESGRIGGENRD